MNSEQFGKASDSAINYALPLKLRCRKYLFVDLRKLLQTGALVRIENQSEGTCEVYGIDRTFYVTMSEKREFVGLLSSWLPENPPVEINVEK